MYLLDTNHCSRIILGDRTITEQLRAHQDDDLAISVITRGELIFMVQKSQRRVENLKAVSAFLRSISLYPVNGKVADVYGELKGNIVSQLGPKAKSERRKVTVQALGFSDNDLWIAATAMRYDLILVSADRDFQRLQSVRSFSVESWV